MNQTNKIIVLLFISFFLSNASIKAQEGFLAEIRMFAGNFPPRGWAFCEGQLVPISRNPALFSLIGTIYGGDGRTTFALPDFRGRVAISAGQGPGLSDYRQGTKGGIEYQTLTEANIPSHNHTVRLSTSPAVRSTPISGDVPAAANFQNGLITEDVKTFGPLASTFGGKTSNTGRGRDFDNRQPFLAVRYIICVQGIFPSRN